MRSQVFRLKRVRAAGEHAASAALVQDVADHFRPALRHPVFLAPRAAGMDDDVGIVRTVVLPPEKPEALPRVCGRQAQDRGRGIVLARCRRQPQRRHVVQVIIHRVPGAHGGVRHRAVDPAPPHTLAERRPGDPRCGAREARVITAERSRPVKSTHASKFVRVSRFHSGKLPFASPPRCGRSAPRPRSRRARAGAPKCRRSAPGSHAPRPRAWRAKPAW